MSCQSSTNILRVAPSQEMMRLYLLSLEFLLICIVCLTSVTQGCKSNQMKCDNGDCIGIRLYCDGVDYDCDDNSDEKASCKSVCPDKSVRCNVTGLCMNMKQFCDKVSDCPDFSDENCGDCPPNTFQCRSTKQCIANTWLCDSYSDCMDSEDEMVELCGSCKDDEFQCSGNKKVCVPLNQTCDGTTHCPEGSDEQGCVVNNDDDKQSLRTNLSPLQFRFAGHEAYKVCSTNWTERMSQKTCQRFSLGSAVKTDRDVSITAENGTLIVNSEIKENDLNILQHLQKNKTCPSGKGIGIVCEAVECGVRAKTAKVDPSGYIINGNLATRGAYPWQVLIEYRDDKARATTQVCGGSIIKDRWILTAAHCAIQFMNPDNVYISAGSVGPKRKPTDPEDKKLTADKIIRHPGYRSDVKRDVVVNDVGLIRLTSPLEYSETIRPICIPGPTDKIQRYKVCVATGFGMEKYEVDGEGEGEFVSRGRYRSLMVGRMQAKSKDKCVKNYHDIYGNKWNITEDELEQVVCGGDVRNSQGTPAACRGDSGGPLACNDYRGIWTLVGVTSFGVEKCSMSVFARVSYYQDWIEQIISENSLD